MNAPTHLPTLMDALPGEPADAPHGLFTRARQVEFLHALADCGAVRTASARIGVSYRTVYRERRANAAFRRAWDAALLSARALSEDVLAGRALDGVEEVVWFRGEEVGRRVRYDSRLLLAHLARLDKLTEDARTRAFADDSEGALARFAAGVDDPAPVCAECGDALPLAQADGGEAGAAFSPGQCDRCDRPPLAAPPQPAREPAPRHDPDDAQRCPDCGGRCGEPGVGAWHRDCDGYEMRIEAMYEAHPAEGPWPSSFPGQEEREVEAVQLAAFEAGVARWWLVLPPDPAGALPTDADGWTYAEDPAAG
ncbi:MAG: hypothetical protein ACTHK5_11930 [Tsuneonella sp.]